MAVGKGAGRPGGDMRKNKDAGDRDKLISELKKENLILRKELQLSREELAARAEELEAQLEELRVNNEELERQIDERRRAESAAKKSRFILAKSQEMAHVGNWAWNVQTGEVNWSDEAYRIYGYSPGEVRPDIGWAMARVHPDDKALLKGFIDSVRRDGIRKGIEHRIVRPDGAIRHVSTIADKIVRGRAGDIKWAYGITQDITERRQAEAELRENETRRKVVEAVEAERKRFFSVLETLPAMICLLTPDHHVAFANRSFRERFGESHGRRCYEYCFGRAEPCEFCETYTVLKTGQPHRWEARCPDGSVIDAYDLPFIDVDGSPMILEMDIDITERKRAEAALRDLNENLEKRVAERTAELQEKQEELEVQAEELEAQAEELHANNEKLAKQVEERKRIEEALQKVNENLETTILERTADLRRANDMLRGEMAERAEAERRVSAERQRFNDVLETLPAYLVLLTPDYHVPFANRFFRERFGESHGRRCFEYLFGRTEPCENCETYKVLKTGTPHRWEWTGPDGRNYDIYDFPFNDTDGSPLIMEMGIDITERKLAETALRDLNENLEKRVAERTAELQKKQEELEVQAEELEAQAEELRANNDELEKQVAERQRAEEALRETSDYLESLVGYANAPIIVWGPDFRITRFNHAFERLTGYAANEVVGRKLEILFPPESREESLAKIERTLAGEYWVSAEIPILKKGGGTRIALWNSANIYRKDGSTLVATIAQGQDITERKLAEEELSEAKAQAELYLDLMDHDISNMHQIALSQLEMAQETLAGEGKLMGEDKELVETPIETLRRSAQLIDNVRKLQKLRAGEYKSEAMDLGALLADVAKENSGVPGNDVKINYNPVSGCYVNANPLLKDVFMNLVGNAIKHSSGHATINMSVASILADGSVQYMAVIEDDGPGIPDDKKEEVFHRFKRGQTRARGTGLGLYIVKTLVDSFHGKVRVEDRVPGDHTKGSRFVVLLPAAEKGPMPAGEDYK